MRSQDIRKLLSLGEGQRIELKPDYRNVDAIGNVICGFLNSSGGYLVCGVAENGEVHGADVSSDHVAALERRLHEGLSPKALVSIEVQTLQGKSVVVIEVPAGKDVPYAFRDSIYIRSGGSTRKADVETIRDLVQRRQTEPERWERRFSFADLETDLDTGEVRRAVSAAEKVRRAFLRDAEDLVKVLEDFSVAKYGRLTNGGDVLFTQNPAARLPQVRVRAASYRSSKASETFSDMKSFEGPLVSVLQQTYDFIVRNTATIATFSSKRLERHDHPLYPEFAVREGLVNALAHRDYSSSSGGVTVGIYPDRLEIWNSGALPKGMTTEKLIMGNLSILRNPDIAHVLYLRGLMEKLGRGSVQIQKECKAFGLPAPKWESEATTGVTLTFYAPPVIKTDVSRIIKYAPPELIGREAETNLLSDAWDQAVRGETKRPHIVTFVALGGEGKTSLVAKWAASLAAEDWPGCDAVFAWSFYSQGTREQLAASSDLFLNEALIFLGDDADKEFAASSAGAFEKGQRLARIVGERRSLLILDGLEPLQYPASATAFKPGELKDPGIAKLLKDLASNSHGLCIVTTRIELPDLQAFKGGAVNEIHLKRLSRDAGVHLLKSMGVKGSELRNIEHGPNKEEVNEFEKLVDDVKGHALTLTLLGGFLKRAFHGDIRQRDRVKFEKADEKMDGGHAFRTMAAYEQWLLRDGGDEGRREVAVLRLMGLFDRPAEAGSLAALRRETIPGLTEPLAGLADDDWEYCLSGLETAKLLTVNRDAAGALVSLDAHPHLREYFARQLRAQQPDAWRAAHRRLYEHLCATTPDKPQPTLEDLQPLYQAVAHGCQAGLQQEALEAVYLRRIRRGNENYAARKLGAFGSDLGAVACFFETPWNRVSSVFSDVNQSWLQNEAAYSLRAMGRLTESLEPMRQGLEMGVKLENWKAASVRASNLSELELTLGEVAGAVGDAEQSVTYADRSGEWMHRMTKRTTNADALQQAGRRAEAETRFREAEQMQAESQPDYPLLYSLSGFRYCDLLLTEAERAAWRKMLQTSETFLSPSIEMEPSAGEPASSIAQSPLLRSCRAVSERAGKTLSWAEQNNVALLDIALDRLTLGRAALYATILEVFDLRTSSSEIDHAVSDLRLAGSQDHLPRGLLTRAWVRFLNGAGTGPESAEEDLDEAWEIAERGPMKLFMADIHLYRARLFHGVMPYPWDKNPDGTPRGPKDDLDAAEKLINECGYHRRDEELADAKEAAKNW